MSRVKTYLKARFIFDNLFYHASIKKNVFFFLFIVLAEGMGAWMPIWMHTVWCYKQDSIPLQFIYILAARNTPLCICALGRRLNKPGSAYFTA